MLTEKKGVIITTSFIFLLISILILLLLLLIIPQAFEVEEELISDFDDLTWVGKNIVENLRTIENKSEVNTYVEFLNFLKDFYPRIEKNLTFIDSSVSIILRTKNCNFSRNLTVGE